jgi:hypothetical protein
MDDLSKDAQLARSPGGNRTCPTTGELKRSCSCYSCVGSRNRRKGKRKQRETRKVLEREFGTAGPTQTVTSHEENWRMRVRLEVKSGKQVESLTKQRLQGGRGYSPVRVRRRPRWHLGPDHRLPAVPAGGRDRGRLPESVLPIIIDSGRYIQVD